MTSSEIKFFLNKTCRTLYLCYNIFTIRMFGKYISSVGGAYFDYAIYEYAGKQYAIPTMINQWNN